MTVSPDAWKAALADFDEKGAPAADDELAGLRNRFGGRIDDSIINLLRVHDGAAGFFSLQNEDSAYVYFFGISRIVEDNEWFDGFDLEPRGILIFGNNGAGEFFVSTHRNERLSIFALPMGSKDPEDLLKLSEGFEEFIEKASTGTLFND